MKAKLYIWLIFFAIIFSAINCDNENEEDSKDFENDCPDQYFWIKNDQFKSVKRKGGSRWLVSLVIPPFKVKNDPTKAIPTIYEEIRRKISKDLDKDQKITFLQEIPS